MARKSDDVAPGIAPVAESEDTTHYSVIDADGNVVSNTYTLNFSYGSGVAVAGAGFLLNNEMDDFSSKPGSANGYGLIGGEANAIQPGKRPLSSMTPTMPITGQGCIATPSVSLYKDTLPDTTGVSSPRQASPMPLTDPTI